MLKQIKTKKLDMLSIFLENRNALPLYKKLTNTISNKEIYKNENPELKSDKTKVFCLFDFPSYLKGDIDNTKWKVNTINSFKGSMIVLRNYTGVDDYLKSKFSSKRRSKFRTYQKRLETSFNITYKTYCGHIELEEYKSIFKDFHALIERRFIEKKTKNYDLTRWDVYHKIAYPLIKNKDAALFVIYHDKKPISICLNLLRGHVIYGYIRAYDINYSKFYLGFIDLIKQLHWCYENGIEIFDLLKGSYAYKAHLTDDEYYFQKHIIYKTDHLLTRIYGQIFSFKIKSFYKLVGILKKVHVDKLYHRFLEYRYRNSENLETKNYTITKEKEINFNNNCLKIEFSNNEYDFLKRPVYDYLYMNQESINTVDIYKLQNEVNTFLITGTKNTRKIEFHS